MWQKKDYRNVFAEVGISEADVAKRLEAIRQTWFYGSDDERVYFPVGDDMAYIMDTGNNDARTEGMSYGMMICVQLDMKEEFDRLWKWAKTYMWMEDGYNEGYFAWSCATDGTKNANALFSISSFNLDTFEKNSIEVITSYNATLYASNNNFYLASTNSFNSLNKTYITIVDMQLNEVGVIRVDGHILNQFSMDEYNGYLRVVTINTLKNDYELNALYIYSLKSLEMVGSITRGIGIERQTIKSTTFAGDVCYAVTYLNKDPLYEIDCSDPTNPYIVSQYEAPGYSSYLKTFEINEKLYTIGTGYDDSFNVKMSVYEQTKDGTFQIGRDLIFSTYRYSNDTELLYYNADYPYNLLNHKALFIYCDDTHIFVGAMVERNLYTIFKVDVTNYSRPISTYLEISVVTDYEAARGFLVDGKFYIPTTNGLNITEWK